MKRHLYRFHRDHFLILVISLIISTLWLLSCENSSESEGIQLEAGFLNPPDSAKPRVWWHWMNGNVTKEGIRADLEWMKRVGIGGFQNFDAGLTTPQVVPIRLTYMTPEWKDAFRFTVNLADSLGLEMAIAGSPGWSESGGPWVKPAEAMKKYVWTETRIEGGKPFSGILPKPPSVTGPFQNIKRRNEFMGGQESNLPEYYADAAVVAYKLPETDLSLESLQPRISSSGGKFNLQKLTDGDLENYSFLPAAKPGATSWIQYEFKEPVTTQALTIVGGGEERMFGPASDKRYLEVSDNGINYQLVTEIPASPVKQKTLAFAPTKGKYFRFSWKKSETLPASIPGLEGMGFGRRPAGPSGTEVSELVLYSTGHVNRFEEKAAFDAATDLYKAFTPQVNAEFVVKKTDVIDLTSKMTGEGKLDWNPPEGNWIILRLGYSLTGQKNGPASPEATGLEVDKLSARHVKAYFTNYLDQYKDATGGLMGKKGLGYIITDSWEAGTQNWTDEMLKEFQKRRGYDMVPWLPVLSGHIVESAEASDKFLWDFRKTLSDLVTENHYDQLTEILNERGMARYSESHEARRAFIGDGMEAKKNAAVPMGAGWTPGGFGGNEGGFATVYQADIRESASVSHLYGQSFTAAESLTAMGTDWAWSPELLKPIADHLMACGLNRFVIHTSVHQPLIDRVPGFSLGPFGQWFTRNETWAEQAVAWTAYLSRSCYMLQQGKFVADVAYYYGEDNNITVLFSKMRGGNLPPVPEGYNYDFVNADALVNLLFVRDGNLTTPSGMTYRLLALDPNSQYMTLPILRKIRDMVMKGAAICGPKPIMDPSLSYDPNEFAKIANQLWVSEKGEKRLGKGVVYSGYTIGEALDAMKILKDFSYIKPTEDSRLFYIHRRVGESDIYWVNNRQSVSQIFETAFRVSEKIPEIWHPETGKIEKSSYKIGNGITSVPLRMEPNDAVFIVFRNKATQNSIEIAPVKETELTTIEGPWDVKFQSNRGAPDQSTFTSLTPWNENTDPGIKYFSGTAIYLNRINIPAEWLSPNAEIWLDLGAVKDLAEVKINGISRGILWKVPFKADITSALRPGNNELEIRVTNLWVNRLVGDRQPSTKQKITFTITEPYRADSPLKLSGLMGPVKILKVTNEK